jgi:TPR repeat protein
MNDKAESQLTLKDCASSLISPSTRSTLIARGHRDAQALTAHLEPCQQQRVPLADSRAKKLAEEGNPVAQYDLGRILSTEFRYLGRRWHQITSTDEVIVIEGIGNDEEAVSWLRKAADQGYAPAQWWLGRVYSDGDEESPWYIANKDFAEAVRWYRKAAEQGYKAAQGDLGGMYEEGRGVNKDWLEAVRWIRKGLAQEKPAEWIAELDANFCASLVFWEAAHQGDGNAQANLGRVMYRLHRYSEAYRWMNLAARNLTGNAQQEANSDLDTYARHLSAEELAEARRL